ncbi:MAG: hypothetical protein DRG30_08970 [Epsilonproteobacteria bacterium]|nr:MAG: hypothetical protein DRG30_08970 [Campylobacterota bacterium]
MLNDDEYEKLKQSFIKSQRLFNKLGKVTRDVENIDYDESGLYQDDEDICHRHWMKLSSKIVDALSVDLEDFTIELLQNDTLDIKELSFNLKNSEQISKIKVDFSENDAISIKQIS